MKEQFSSGRRKFFSLLPFAATLKGHSADKPEPVKNQAFVITASGKVGIGVNTPAATLHIQSGSASSIRLL
jgi:hypothetical protein